MKLYQGPWNEFATMYTYYTSPTAPSKQDISIIKKHLMKMLSEKKPEKKQPGILILGCTRAYRRLMAGHCLSADLADLNSRMHRTNTRALKDIKRKERFIKADWRSMSLKKRYDLILGDFAVNNIHARDKSRFYRNIIKHLKKDGLFITRIGVQPAKPLRKEQVFRMYRNKRVTKKALNELSWDAIFNLGLDRKRGTAENRKGFLELSSYTSKHNHMKKWAEHYAEKFPTVEKEWSMLKEADQERELRKYFDIIAKKHAHDYRYWEICPTYLLKRK